jgi:hypothetical protein
VGFWIAFVYKTIVDGIPIEIVLDRWGIMAAEGVYVLFGVAGAWGLWRLRRCGWGAQLPPRGLAH